MNRNSTCTTALLGVGMLMWACTGVLLSSSAVGAEKDSDVDDAVAEWHIRLRGTKA
ncbi:MAG: hypothetical protein H8E44_25490 [Planctomycetes bacterium]|nr:hypothetical protein [Planctomycetota bacterium]